MPNEHVHINRQLAGTPKEVTIPASSDTSDSFGLMQATAGSFQTPASIDSTTMGFEVSYDNSTWVTLRKIDGTDVSIPVAASGGYPLPFELFVHAYGRFVSGSTESPALVLVITLEN